MLTKGHTETAQNNAHISRRFDRLEDRIATIEKASGDRSVNN